MKLWEKIYVVVMALFLLVLNSCHVLVFQSSYQKNIDAMEKTAEVYWKQIAFSLAEDLAENPYDETSEWQIFQAYVSGYSMHGYAFELWRDYELREKSKIDTQITYSEQEGKLVSDFLKEKDQQDAVLAPRKKTGQVRIWTLDGEKYMCASGPLSGTPYQLVIYENVTDLFTVWDKQILRFVLLEIAASLLMAVLLYRIMKKFVEPVSVLSAVTERIASGDYSCRAEFTGADELSLLAEDINYMTGQIRGHIQDKEAEAKQKQEFIDALSHELRTPLTSIRGYAQLVCNTAVSTEKQMEYMDYIVQESGRMVDIMETLRRVILLQQENIETEEIPLGELADWLQETTAMQLTGKQIRWSFEAEEGIVAGERVLVELFFLNLIRNSFHACGKEGKISVVLHRKGAVISDDGIGMSEDCVKHIFEPFYREDPSRSRKLGGTGLGMYLCRHIADRHQWSIHIESVKGQGTEIFVYFTTLSQPD